MREGSGSEAGSGSGSIPVTSGSGSKRSKKYGSGSATLLARLFAVVPGEGGGSAVLRAAGHVTPLHTLVLLLHQVISKHSVTSCIIG
jgi:hypothetical protein